MKKILAIFLVPCIAVLLLSVPVHANLWEGSWNSSSDFVQLGTWNEALVGTYPDYGFPEYVGSIGSGVSTNLAGIGSWNCYSERTGLQFDSGYYVRTTDVPIGTTHARDFIATMDAKGRGVFLDGNEYTSVMNNVTATYTLFFHYFPGQDLYAPTGCSQIIWQGGGDVNDANGNPTNFYFAFLARGTQTFNIGNYFHGGTIDYVEGTLKDNAVPIPGAIWILGSGLLGLLGFRRKMS